MHAWDCTDVFVNFIKTQDVEVKNTNGDDE